MPIIFQVGSLIALLALIPLFFTRTRRQDEAQRTSSVISGIERLDVNARRAIFHQWEQLEASGCIENFRLAAGKTTAAARAGSSPIRTPTNGWMPRRASGRSTPTPHLGQLMDELDRPAGSRPGRRMATSSPTIRSISPGMRWQNLQIEHELYCHGHLIEAGVSHFEATGRRPAGDCPARCRPDRGGFSRQGAGVHPGA